MIGQVSSKLRRVYGGLAHWCPGCEEMHRLSEGREWTFNGDLESPTCTPSFRHSGYSKHGVERVCHYMLTDGVLNFYGDSTHALAGKAVPLPALPAGVADDT